MGVELGGVDAERDEPRESTKCGTAPQYDTALAVAMKVSVGISTSSPGSTPASSRQMCSAEVPFDVATACAAPVTAARSRSKRSTNEPTDETQPVSMHSLTYSHSLPANSGSCRAIVLVAGPTTARTAATTASTTPARCSAAGDGHGGDAQRL